MIQSRIAYRIDALQHGTRVLSADILSGTENLIAIHSPVLLILDLHLPDGNALERLEFFKWMAPAMQIAVFSNDNAAFVQQMCFERGTDWVFDKSTDIVKLMETVDLIQKIHCDMLC